MTDYRESEGVMFIGDPHVSSKTPGRRKDTDYSDRILGKISFLIDMCNERRLIPVFLGDMFDTAYEPSEKLKTKLIRTLRKSWTVPLANVGNHDIANAVLSDGDSLAILHEAGVVKLNAYAGALETIKVGDNLWGIGATPYGQEFPLDARPFFGKVNMIIWLTHHDLAFENPYPGSQPLPEIKGCNLMVNGHMHLKKKTRKVGNTVCFNPGNITRQAIDAIEHEPAANILTKAGKLERIVIPHERNVFKTEHLLAPSISPGEVMTEEQKTELAELQDSEFVNMLTADAAMEMDKSDDGSIIHAEIVHKFEREKTDDVSRAYILGLWKKAVEGKEAA